MNEKSVAPDWPDCGEVQCKQSHASMDAIIQMMDIECPKEIYIVGKAARICQKWQQVSEENIKLKAMIKESMGSVEFVEFWKGLNHKQLCTLAAQCLLRAADKTP